MDTLLKKYAERIDERFSSVYVNRLITEKLLLQFLLEYIELREERKNKKEK